MKRLLSIVIVTALMLSHTSFAFANSKTQFSGAIAKAAYISEINEDGSNVSTDAINPEYILDSKDYDICIEKQDNELFFTGSVSGMPFTVSSKLITTNENRNMLLYRGDDESGNFKIATISIDRELPQTPVFFRTFQEENSLQLNVIKLYVQPKDANSLILFEVFIPEDFVHDYLSENDVMYNDAIAHDIQYWFLKFYGPIEKAGGNSFAPPLKSNVYYNTLDFTEVYTINGIWVSFNFMVFCYCPFPDVTRNQSGNASLYFYVYRSDVLSQLEVNNSSTQNYLRLQNMNIRIAGIPNIIFTNQSPYRNSIKKSTGITNISFSVSFGYTYGPISASGSFNFTDNLTMNTSLVPIPYNTTKGGKATSCGQLPSGYYLSQQGGYYGINLTFMDKGGVASSRTVTVLYDYYLNNMYDSSDSFSDTLTKTFTLNIT